MASPSFTITSHEFSSQRKNALTTRLIVSIARELGRKVGLRLVALEVLARGLVLATSVCGPTERLRVKTSYPSTEAWRCISRSPEAS